ncbi:MAG: hypothetical protein E4H13_06155 [Calditrichales bacterium]|nr:MAG: hypothetical protein E4H13_06155 [Calditrichales bacterium]
MRYLLFVLSFILIVCPVSPAADDFPALSGWEQTGEIQNYSPDNLWEYINGAADQFIDFNMQNLRMAEFTNGDVSVSVDIYDMELPRQAFGIYANESRGLTMRVQVGSQAALSLPAQLLMFKDKYYVKIYAFEGKLDETAGRQLLEMIAESLPGESRMPEQFDWLPAQNRKAGSEGFYRIGYLGLSELKNCLYAVYSDSNATEFQYFLTFPPTPGSTVTYLEEMKTRWKTAVVDGLTLYYREIPYQGFTGLLATAKGIFGTSDAPNLQVLAERLKFFAE